LKAFRSLLVVVRSGRSCKRGPALDEGSISSGGLSGQENIGRTEPALGGNGRKGKSGDDGGAAATYLFCTLPCQCCFKQDPLPV